MRKLALRVAAIALSALGPAISVLLVSELQATGTYSDGQAGLEMILGGQVGMLLGAGALVSALIYDKRPRAAAASLQIAGALGLMYCVKEALYSASSHGLSISEFLGTLTTYWIFLPLIFCLAVLGSGYWMFVGRGMNAALRSNIG
jgi:hypothetical protein